MRLPPDGNDDLLAELRSSVVPVEDADAAALQRKRVVERMRLLQAGALRRRASGPRRRAAVVIVGSVLALTAAAWAFMRRSPPSPMSSDGSAVLRAGAVGVVVVRANSTLASDLGTDAVLLPLDHVRTADNGDATVVLPSGAVVVESGKTDLSLVAATRALEKVLLERGRVDVRVPRRSNGEAFVVETPDATVTVHGTRFSVSFSESCHRSLCTRVEVTEGRVGVLHGGVATELHAGEVWPQDDTSPKQTDLADPTTVPPVVPATVPPVASAPSHPGAFAGRSRPGPSASGARSSLAEETALLQRAMVAERSGAPTVTVQLLDEFLSKYPSSPLGRNAELERLRALHRAGNANVARTAARHYLARYPEGMGTEEARHIAIDGTEATSSSSPRSPSR